MVRRGKQLREIFPEKMLGTQSAQKAPSAGFYRSLTVKATVSRAVCKEDLRYVAIAIVDH